VVTMENRYIAARVRVKFTKGRRQCPGSLRIHCIFDRRPMQRNHCHTFVHNHFYRHSPPPVLPGCNDQEIKPQVI